MQMNAHPRIKVLLKILIIIFLSLIIVSYFQVNYVNKLMNKVDYSSVVSQGKKVSSHLTKNFTLNQSALVSGTMEGVGIQFGTYDRDNSAYIKLEISVNDVVYYSKNINTYDLKDNEYNNFDFGKTINLDKDSKINISITGIDGTVQNSPSVYLSDTQSANSICMINGIEINGSLNFQTYVTEKHTFIQYVYWMLSFILIFLIILIYVFVSILHKPVEQCFVLAISILGLIMTFVITPDSVPDEPNHFITAYNYSNIIMGDGKYYTNSADGVDRVKVRECDNIPIDTNLSLNHYNNVFKKFQLKASSTKLVTRKGIVVETSPFYTYLPQCLGITVGRLLNFGYIPIYYFARLLNFIFCVWCMFISIHIIPFGKSFIAVIGLSPMFLQQAFSLSPDAVIFGLSILLVSYIFEKAFTKNKIGYKEIIVFLILSCLITPCKMVYCLLPILVFLIPNENFKSKKIAITMKILIPLIAVIVLLGVQSKYFLKYTVAKTSDTVTQNKLAKYSLSYFISNPIQFFNIITKTIIEYSTTYINTTVGSSFGWFQIAIPGSMTIIMLITAAFSIFANNEKGEQPNKNDKFIASSTLILSFILVLLSMLFTWTNHTSEIIQGVQGRYFIPLLPIAALYGKTNKIRIHTSVEGSFVFLMTILSSITALDIFSQAILI